MTVWRLARDAVAWTALPVCLATGAPHAPLATAERWTLVRPGVGRAVMTLEGFRLVVVRIDPARVRITLASATRDAGMRGAWTIDSAPSDVVVALNAGQFAGGDPWGWIVRDGHEIAPPGHGPLASAVVIDRAGTVRLVGADSVTAVRAAGTAITAFESYPTLLWGDAEVPEPLRAPGRGVDLDHRDGRLALGVRRDGRVIIVLTRFVTDAATPFGPTIPEMASLMRALGCRAAVALDGGLSAQMLLRDTAGRAIRWPGLRRVPLAVTVRSLEAFSGPGRR